MNVRLFWNQLILRNLSHLLLLLWFESNDSKEAKKEFFFSPIKPDTLSLFTVNIAM